MVEGCPGALPVGHQSEAWKAACNMVARAIGTFGTPDFYEDRSMGFVVKCICMYAGVIQAVLPSVAGPKLASGNPR